ncbi:MAG TPA: hypothetical protein VJY39_12620 [Acidisphaera sp.]|nr:hypothetical protein [Acidisphaera sp.]
MSLARLSRRSAIIGAGCLLGCTGAAHGQLAPHQASSPRCPDAAPAVTLSAEERERHAIFMLLAMALTHDGWGVDRSRPDLVAAYAAVEPKRSFSDYLGHNIGAVLVGRDSQIVCFALNRSVELNSTLERAEARCIRAAFAIANAGLVPGALPPWTFGRLLQPDRLYTTLEPCAQCAGIMDLANVQAVVFAQDDPGQHHIVDILYNLPRERGEPAAPLPLAADFLPVWKDLAASYNRFLATALPDGRTGVTSFLQSVDAYLIYRDAAARFADMRVQHRANEDPLRDARAFRAEWGAKVQSGLVPS